MLGPAQGTKKGIGIVGAKTILEMYKQEFGDPVLNDPDLFENIADLICEKKKINRSQISKISDNIRKNMELINLEVNNLPTEVIQRMKTLSI